MLVISQKKGEKIHIGRDITITILDLKAGKARIGIQAPKDCPILRDSLVTNADEHRLTKAQAELAKYTLNKESDK